MKIADINVDDILVSVDRRGTGYCKVVKVNRVTVDVLCENGNMARMFPVTFDRRVTYAVAAFQTKK